MNYFSLPLKTRLARYLKNRDRAPCCGYTRPGGGFYLIPELRPDADKNPARFEIGQSSPVFVARGVFAVLPCAVENSPCWNLTGGERFTLPAGLRVRVDCPGMIGEGITCCAVDEAGEALELFPSAYRFGVPAGVLESAGVKLFSPPPAATLLWIEEAHCLARSIRFCDDVAKSIRHTGWFLDNFQDDKARGVVLALSHGRFLAGIADPYNFDTQAKQGPCIIETGRIFDDETKAAHVADDLAEECAENAREEFEADQQAQREEKAREDAEAARVLELQTLAAVCWP